MSNKVSFRLRNCTNARQYPIWEYNLLIKFNHSRDRFLLHVSSISNITYPHSPMDLSQGRCMDQFAKIATYGLLWCLSTKKISRTGYERFFIILWKYNCKEMSLINASIFLSQLTDIDKWIIMHIKIETIVS